MVREGSAYKWLDKTHGDKTHVFAVSEETQAHTTISGAYDTCRKPSLRVAGTPNTPTRRTLHGTCYLHNQNSLLDQGGVLLPKESHVRLVPADVEAGRRGARGGVKH